MMNIWFKQRKPRAFNFKAWYYKGDLPPAYNKLDLLEGKQQIQFRKTKFAHRKKNGRTLLLFIIIAACLLWYIIK